ncbi:hypothetical protein PV328_002586 [Microctonus aethiopoides]|uniref:UBX domain-containing protein 11 n=1 Tax=Microctonus aethiopoides TaxID=144406 RepID=A0AA39KJR5_9HYME|nr:hypothetical protein PV328_002586 [Microctonus aethiopoides]
MDFDSKKWQNIAKQQTCKAEKEGDLVGMLSKQLYLAGDQMQRMQAVLKKAEDRMKLKDQEISRLKRKAKEWELKSKDQELANKKEKSQRITQLENSDYMYKQCLKLEHKLLEMEKFLADYGLVWLGESSNNKTKNSDELSNNFINDCYIKLMANVEELNLSVGKGEMHVCRHQGGATFKAPSCMILKFYKNGMIVGQKGRLRHYRESITQSFIRDILDGYFPSELQHEYPNGVAFKVEDHRTETYFGDGFNYPGHGYQLGKLPSYGQIRCSSSSPKVKISTTPLKSSSSDWKTQCNSSNLNIASNSSRVGMNNSPIPNGILKNTSSSVSKLDSDLFNSKNQTPPSTKYNNSDTHIKSHGSIESTSNLKTEKVPSVTRSTECHLPVKEKISSFKSTESSSTTNTNHRFQSTNQLSFDNPISRGIVSDVGSPRPRSVSLSGSRSSKQFPKISSVDNNLTSIKNVNYPSDHKFSKLRPSKSATSEKYKYEMPVMQEINEPTGEIGELRLKVRSMTGTVVYLVHISADDTVARLYQLLNTVLSLKRTSNATRYKIVISGYTPKRLDHMNVTLRNYGINRDSVLHLVEN